MLKSLRAFLLWEGPLPFAFEKKLAFFLLITIPFVFSVTSPEGMREPKAKFLCILFGVYIAVNVYAKINKVFGLASLYSVYRFYFSETGFIYEDFFVFVVAIATCLWVANPSNREIRQVARTAEYLGFVFLLYGASQMAGYDPIQTYHSWADHRPVVFFGQHTLYAPIAAVCFTSALIYRRWISAVILFIPAILIDSSFSYLSFFAGIGVFAYKEFGWRIVWLPTSGLIALFVMKHVMYDSYRELYNDRGRFNVWGQTYFLSEKRPLLGYGGSSFKQIYPIFQNPILRKRAGIKEEELSTDARAFMARAEKMAVESGFFLNPHNEYLAAKFYGGWIGLLFVFFCQLVFYGCFFSIKTKVIEDWFVAAVFTIFSVNSLGSFPMHLIPQALFPLWAFTAMTTRNKWSILSLYAYARNIRTFQGRRSSLRHS